MKHTLLTFILLMGILYCNAQGIVSIGIKGGASFANMTYDYQKQGEKTKYQYKAGYICALSIEFFKGKYLSFSTDLGYVQKGMKYGDIFIAENYKRECVFFSPMLTAFHDFDKITAYVSLGPRVDFDFTYPLTPGFTHDSKLRRATYGLSYGVGAEYRVQKFGFILEFMGQPDLTPLLKPMTSHSDTGLKVKSNAFILTPGVKFYFH
jgi:hypothetical protein